MKTEAEVRAAAETFAWYVASGRIRRQDPATQQNIIGTIAALEWLLKSEAEDPRNPVAGALRDIAAMQAGPERN